MFLKLNWSFSSWGSRSSWNSRELFVRYETRSILKCFQIISIEISISLSFRWSIQILSQCLVSSPWFVIHSIIVIISVTTGDSSRLIEESLIILYFISIDSWVCDSQSNLFTDISFSFSFQSGSFVRSSPSNILVSLSVSMSLPSNLVSFLDIFIFVSIIVIIRGSNTSSFFSSLLCQQPKVFFFLLLLFLSNLLFHLSSHLNLFSCLSISNIKSFRHLCQLLINMCLLKTSSISSQSLVQRNRISLCIFPVGDTGRNLPLLLFFDSYFPCGWMHDWRRRRWRSSRNLLIDLKLGRFKGILLYLNHTNDSLSRSWCWRSSFLWRSDCQLITRSVSDILGRSCLFCSSHRKCCWNFWLGQFLQSQSGCFCCSSDFIFVWFL